MPSDSRGASANASAPVNGYFHRRESPTQTSGDAAEQVRSREIWGRPARGSSILSVKAYRHRLPANERGIEFTTAIAPHMGGGTPYEARWYYPHTPGVQERHKGGDDYAAISTTSIKNMQP